MKEKREERREYQKKERRGVPVAERERETKKTVGVKSVCICVFACVVCVCLESERMMEGQPDRSRASTETGCRITLTVMHPIAA